jgi:hypothetical protein
MNTRSVDIAHAIQQVRELMNKANAEIVTNFRGADVDNEPLAGYLFHSAFMHLLVLLEALGLAAAREHASQDYQDARTNFLKMDWFEGEAYFEWTDRLSIHLHALEATFGIKDDQVIERDLHSILRNMEYTIADRSVFGGPPSNETELHRRAEVILRSVFGSEVLTKPPIAKTIKNFVPDTGIPSAKTLIEYKFIGNRRDLGRIADQVLADTRGYTSRNWNHFAFMIYEVERFKSEAQWNRLLSECDSADRTTAIVVRGSGASAAKRRRPLRGAIPRGRVP